MALILRSTKGSRLTHAEVDGNFSHLSDASGITYTPSGSETIPTTVERKLQEEKSIFDFIPVALQSGIKLGTETTDLITYLANARTWAAAQTLPAVLTWPAGRYYSSEWPNWAIQDFLMEAQGEVRLRNTGSANNTLIVDGGAAGGGVYNCHIGGSGRFLIESPSTGGHGVYARAIHHGKVRAKVLGCGTSSAGLKTLWCVCTEFDVVVSVNEEGAWFSSGKPAFGYDLNIRGAGEFTSYCHFQNPIVEGPDIGIQLNGTLGNNFWGGTSEACSTYGVHASSAAHFDKFWGHDMEANTVADVFCQGDGVTFIECDSDSQCTLGSTSIECKVLGGNFKTFLLDSGSTNNTVRDIKYNRADDGGTFTEAGNGNRVFNITDGGDGYPLSDGELYVTFEDDFLGDSLAAAWNGAVGTDPQCVTPTADQSILGGVVRLVTGDDAAANMATNGVQLNLGTLQWRINSGGFELEFRVKLYEVTGVCWFVGMTDTVAFEMPFTISGTTLTSNATDAFGILFDTEATTDNWKLVGVANDVDATVQDAGVDPAAGVYERWRIQVTSAGVARFYRNGALIGTAMTGAVTASVLMTPVVAAFSRTTTVRNIDVDRIKLRALRV